MACLRNRLGSALVAPIGVSLITKPSAIRNVSKQNHEHKFNTMLFSQSQTICVATVFLACKPGKKKQKLGLETICNPLCNQKRDRHLALSFKNLNQRQLYWWCCFFRNLIIIFSLVHPLQTHLQFCMQTEKKR